MASYLEKKNINNFLLELMTDIGNDGRLLKDVFYELVDKHQLKNTLLFQLYENEIIMMMGIDTYYSTKYMDLYLELVKKYENDIMELIKGKKVTHTRFILSLIFMIFHEYAYLNCNKPKHQKYNFTYFLLSSFIQETSFIFTSDNTNFNYYKIHMKYSGDVIKYNCKDNTITTIEVKNRESGCKRIIEDDYIPRKILGKTNYKLCECIYFKNYKINNNTLNIEFNITYKENGIDYVLINQYINEILNTFNNLINTKYDYYNILHLINSNNNNSIKYKHNDTHIEKEESKLNEDLINEQYGINEVFTGWK
jgi:hypothetical protein